MAQKFGFASTNEEAVERAEKFQKVDPFPSIPRALLSSAEIRDYARVTAMLVPFRPKSLKSASYEAHLGGIFTIWDEKGEKTEQNVVEGTNIILPANSIAFAQIEPHFRLPDYIAMRFNLRITHVHRGLLLGTGPLVDPGFHGKLLIPLHNLTSSDYELDTTEALIWIEFTKTTYGFVPEEEEADTDRVYKGFPIDKRNLPPETYFQKANGGNPIRSSIPDIIQRSEKEADTARQDAKKARDAAVAAEQSAKSLSKRTTISGIIGLMGLIIALYTVSVDTRSLVQGSQEIISAAIKDIADLGGRVDQITIEAQVLSKQLGEASTRNSQLNEEKKRFASETQVSELRMGLAVLKEQIARLQRELWEKLPAKP